MVAGGSLLAIPTLLVGNDDGGEDGEALDGQCDVGKVGNGAVAVLEVEGVEKLSGAGAEAECVVIGPVEITSDMGVEES